MSLFSVIGTLIKDITLFQTGMYLAILGLSIGLTRLLTKSTKDFPVIFGMIMTFIGITVLIPIPKLGTYCLLTAALSVILWFTPIFSKGEKNDLSSD